ncbi:MAG: glycine betaine ABC transporter substrate-binding protein [Halofilum sp. (in: g-proteobacteria)]
MRKTIWSLAGVLALSFGATNAQAQDDDTIQIGWTAWSDAEFITKLTARVLEERMDQDVELIQTDIAPQYQGVANGDIDMMLMSWLPGTHADYWEDFAAEVTNLGILYDHAKLGWVVPDYIPEDELSSIADLDNDEIRERLDGTITGIDPGAGLTRLSEQALEDYGLDGYELQVSSGAGMTAALDRAVNNEEWIVVTGWSPHWKFGAYDLRYIEDPEGTLGSFERIHALAREGFAGENHDAASMVGRIWMPLDELQAAMFEARETSYEEAVDAYIEENEARINYWVTGEI